MGLSIHVDTLNWKVLLMSFKPTFNVVLVAPEIPQNTGNIIRLCANLGARLHLVEPLGFNLENPGLKRASLDYNDLTDVTVHESIDSFLGSVSINRVFGAMMPGTVFYNDPRYQLGDTIVFGSESTGLDSEVVEKIYHENRIQIPMKPANRSLNISNAVAIIVYEMWSQIEFFGSAALSDSTKLHW